MAMSADRSLMLHKTLSGGTVNDGVTIATVTAPSDGLMTICVQFSTALAALDVDENDGSNTVTQQFNDGTALPLGKVQMFDLLAQKDSTYAFQPNGNNVTVDKLFVSLRAF